MSGIAVSTTINGDDVEFLCQFEETLLDVLRDHLGLMTLMATRLPRPHHESLHPVARGKRLSAWLFDQ
jgi:hypothetical protein